MGSKLEETEWSSTMKCVTGRRGRQDIIMGILRTAKQGSNKGNIIDKVNLSSAQCGRYLDSLCEAGYISESSGIWKTTDKGLQVIGACMICQNLMNMT